ncbi:MAG TPA: HD domain-containing protein [Pyrinomonadaceae bacterium]|jgi:hypothetical protein
MPSEIPSKILRLAQAVREAGGRALLVGGCVRDRLMNRRVKDWDVEVYRVEPARLRKLLDEFGTVNVVGEAFTVYKLGHNLDVSLPRRERKAGRGHRGFVIEGDPHMAFDEAARRRDFTINAILEDPLEAEIIDPFRGRDDIRARLLRAVSRDTFAEDSLRVLRAAQFAARFEFQIEPDTVELCRTIDLSDLPPERVWGELEKLLLHAERPSIGFEWLERLGATAQLFPEIQALKGVPQEYDWHPEGWLLEPLAVPPQSFEASVTQPIGVNGSFSLREFFAEPSASSTMIPTSHSAAHTQTHNTLPASLPTADSARTNDSEPTPSASPTILAQAESLVWSFSTTTSGANEIVRVVFEIPLNRVRSIVRRAVNDFEIVRGVIHPVAVFVMNMLPSFKTPTELQLHDKSVDRNSPISLLPTGVHVTSVIVDARAASINGDVLFDFDLAIVRDAEFIHNGEGAPKPQSFLVKIGDVFYHTQLTLDRARELIEGLDYPRQLTVMLAALCHDFGKPSTTEFVEGRWRSRGHDEAGVEPTERFLDRLRIHTVSGYDVRSQVLALVREHLKPGEFYQRRDEIGDGAFRRLARRCELELLYLVARADTLGRNAPHVPPERRYDAVPQEWFIERARQLAVEKRPPAPLLMGRHLIEMGLKPSPLFGRITDAVYEMQLDGKVSTLEEAREAARRLLKEEGEG